MTFDCRLVKITGPVVRVLYCPSTQNLVKNPFMKSR